jgi:hypothetical protein
MLLPTRIKLVQKADTRDAPFEGGVLIRSRAGLSLPRRR